MTIDDIIASVDTIAYWNPSMKSLYDTLVAQKDLMGDSAAAVADSESKGLPIYETLVRVQVELANAVHDYVYNIVYPFDSIMTKNTCREDICADIFVLSVTHTDKDAKHHG